MVSADFKKLKYFSEREITRIPGEGLANIKFSLMQSLDYFRGGIMAAIKILCVTSGTHVDGSAHYNGQAVDFVFSNGYTPTIEQLIQTASKCLFTGVGVYWNGVAQSYHLDIGHDDPTFWRGWKREAGRGEWIYAPLIGDIRKKP